MPPVEAPMDKVAKKLAKMEAQRSPSDQEPLANEEEGQNYSPGGTILRGN